MKQDDRKISIVIPTYNRFEMTLESFWGVYLDDRVQSIVIVDDASTDGSFEKMLDLREHLHKIEVLRQLQNRDCYVNKRSAVRESSNEYCILLDSDNKIDKSYLDAIFNEEWDQDTILTPEFARPQFDFRAYSGMTFSKENAAEYVDRPMWEVMLNACNYFVNRDSYLAVWDRDCDPVTSDSIYQAYNWLASGRKIKVVKGLQYEHTVHSGSHYQTQNHRTPQGFHESILQKLRSLK